MGLGSWGWGQGISYHVFLQLCLMNTSKNEVLEAMLWLTTGNHHKFLNKEWQVRCWKGLTYMMGRALEVGRNWRRRVKLPLWVTELKNSHYNCQLLSLTQAFHEKPWKARRSQHLVDPFYSKGWEESMWITQRRGVIFGSPPCPNFFETQFWNHTGHIHWMDCSRIHWIELEKETKNIP